VQPLFCRQAISITYSECAFLGLGTQREIRMRHIVIRDLPGCIIFFHLPHKRNDLRENIKVKK
jgi:hypothetical protein